MMIFSLKLDNFTNGHLCLRSSSSFFVQKATILYIILSWEIFGKGLSSVLRLREHRNVLLNNSEFKRLSRAEGPDGPKHELDVLGPEPAFRMDGWMLRKIKK